MITQQFGVDASARFAIRRTAGFCGSNRSIITVSRLFGINMFKTEGRRPTKHKCLESGSDDEAAN